MRLQGTVSKFRRIICCTFCWHIRGWKAFGEELHVLRRVRCSSATWSGVLQQVRQADRRSSLACATSAGAGAGTCSTARFVLVGFLRVQHDWCHHSLRDCKYLVRPFPTDGGAECSHFFFAPAAERNRDAAAG